MRSPVSPVLIQVSPTPVRPSAYRGCECRLMHFRLWACGPLVGRTLVAEDDRNGAQGVVLISYGLWSRHYARNPDVIGRAVNINGEVREIVGVLPASFALPNLDSEIVVPLQPESDPRRNARNSVNFLRMVGRLKPSVTAQQAHAELDSIRQNLHRQFPDTDAGKIGITIVPLTQEIVTNVKALLLMIFVRRGQFCSSAALIWPAFHSPARARDNASWRCEQRLAQRGRSSSVFCSRRLSFSRQSVELSVYCLSSGDRVHYSVSCQRICRGSKTFRSIGQCSPSSAC